MDVRVANDLLYLHLRLIQSALGQKVEAKPVSPVAHRERSQGGAAMRCREVACLPGKMELHLGWTQERASSLLAKFDLLASDATGRAAAHAVSGAPMSPVVHAITSGTWNTRFTDEVPRRPTLRGWVNLGYKLDTKDWGDASARGTALSRPPPKGCQQRLSRSRRGQSIAHAHSERQNLRVLSGPLRFMGPVSLAIKAPKWPEGTSSPQLASPLSNSPQQPERLRAAVRLH